MLPTPIVSRRGGVAVITLLLVAGIALVVALAAGTAAVSSSRAGRDRLASERAFAAAESGAVDAARRLGREPGLASLSAFAVDGIVVARSLAASGDARTVVASASVNGVTANVAAVCSMSAGTCVFRRQ